MPRNSYLGPRGEPMRAPTTDRPSGGSFDALVGTVIAGRFFLEARIGRGSMGTVYRARHLRFGRLFAVKVPHPHLLASEGVARRFDREAALAGKLQHRNLVPVVEGGTDEGTRYLVMDYIEGPTLGDAIERGPMPASQVMRLLHQLCDGLHHAHEAGLVHRDFKPDNVIVERFGQPDENARITDFGIALLRDGDTEERERLAAARIVLGTPHYMAPEQSTGRAIDHRIDLFALGVMCFEMLTGQLPFDGDGIDVARANLLDEPPAMADRLPGLVVDPLLEAFARLLMAKSADDRPATARHARKLLELIETDRDAAALALGITPEQRDSTPVLVAVERASRPNIAIASPAQVRTWPASSVPIPTAPGGSAELREPVPAGRLGDYVVIAIAIACIVAAALLLVT